MFSAFQYQKVRKLKHKRERFLALRKQKYVGEARAEEIQKGRVG